MQLIGLPGTNRVRRYHHAKTVAEVIRLLKAGHVASSAGDFGAFNVWRDRKGIIRAEAYRNRLTLDKQEFTTLTHVRSWAAKWLKEIQPS
jgi:hypothetical protein